MLRPRTTIPILLSALIMSCSTDMPRPFEDPASRPTVDPGNKPATTVATVREYRYRVVRTLPHDQTAFTQGLVVHNGKFVESTGQNGKSTIRIVDISSGKVLKQHALEAMYFGEGMAVIGSNAYMLTWLNQQGFVFDTKTLKQKGTFRYSGEGWGLTSDGTYLYMSNGSNTITVLDPKDFSIVRTIRATLNGSPQNQLNELEWIEGEIWANVWRSDAIVRIDPATGKVEGVLNLQGLLPAAERQYDTDVLNGIAYDVQSKSLYVTGKNWPHVYEIVLE